MLRVMWFPDVQAIRDAVNRIDPVFLGTPLVRSPALDRRFAAQILFKDETANPIRSFKGRGACTLFHRLGAPGGIVCASAGNFGQALAWAGRARAVPVTVFAAATAVRSKLDAMRSLGATVLLAGEDFDAAKEAAAAWAGEHGLPYIEDGSRADIAEGAGTLLLEVTDEVSEIDVVLCPLGNGALAAGVGAWLKHKLPEAAMIAVAARGAPAMAESVRTGRIVQTATAETIADGIAVRVPIPSAVSAVRHVVDDVVLVGDDDIRSAMALLGEELGLTVEPAGAAGFAALLAAPDRWRGKRIVVPLCGGNV